jgi:hypothetical protein
MRMTVRVAMFALLVGAPPAAAAVNSARRPEAANLAGLRAETDTHGAQYAMRPSDPHVHARPTSATA